MNCDGIKNTNKDINRFGYLYANLLIKVKFTEFCWNDIIEEFPVIIPSGDFVSLLKVVISIC